jgi:hypothetical protein
MARRLTPLAWLPLVLTLAACPRQPTPTTASAAPAAGALPAGSQGLADERPDQRRAAHAVQPRQPPAGQFTAADAARAPDLPPARRQHFG